MLKNSIAIVLQALIGLLCCIPGSAAADSESNLDFSLKLYGKLAGGKGNLAVSPYSIEEALALALAGAKGETAKEIARVLYNSDSPSTRSSVLRSALKQYSADGQVEINIANALWLQKSYRFLDDYLKTAQDAFQAELRYGDFVKAAESARLEINAWVSAVTKTKIPELIPAGMLDAATRLVVVNAIYFKADWKEAFNVQATQEQDFWKGDAEKIRVPMMSQSDEFRYYESDAAQLLELPYMGEKVAMLLLLPKGKDGLARLEQSLNASSLSQSIDKLQSQKVLVKLPRFKAEAKAQLGDILKSLGMRAAFSRAADFSGMDGTRDLSISEVIHQAVVETDEKGTVAAAATAIAVRAASIPKPPPQFIADHPFIYFIVDTASRNILFMGRVDDPRK